MRPRPALITIAGIPEGLLHELSIAFPEQAERQRAIPQARRVDAEHGRKHGHADESLHPPEGAIDLLLDAFAREFASDEPVSLIIKDFGGDSFYRGQTAALLIERCRSQGVSIEVIDKNLSAEELKNASNH